MMIAHVTYPQVDSVPAGYSQTWLKKVLRDEMGYRGVILSDDLGMHAARSVGGLQERARLSLAAGCDLVLVCQPPDVAELLGGWQGDLPDAGDAIARLYGRPTVSPEELASVDREGIKEWSRWRQSLEELGRQAWA
jgi:beta-N-acetylhexosaminidase